MVRSSRWLRPAWSPAPMPLNHLMPNAVCFSGRGTQFESDKMSRSARPSPARYDPATQRQEWEMSTQLDYSRIPQLPASVYVAPLKKPAGLANDWLEPAQHRYTADEHRTW